MLCWRKKLIYLHLHMLSCIGSTAYLTKFSIFCVRLWLPVCVTIASGLQARENRSPLPSRVSSVLMSLFTPNTYCLLVATIICLVQMWTKTRRVFASTFLGSGPHTLWIKVLKNEAVKQYVSCPSVCLPFVDFYLSHLKSSFGELLLNYLYLH